MKRLIAAWRAWRVRRLRLRVLGPSLTRRRPRRDVELERDVTEALAVTRTLPASRRLGVFLALSERIGLAEYRGVSSTVLDTARDAVASELRDAFRAREPVGDRTSVN